MRDRGCPWRPCDIWDEVHNALPNQLRAEANDPKLVMTHIQVNDGEFCFTFTYCFSTGLFFLFICIGDCSAIGSK